MTLTIGVDVGGTKIAAGLVDNEGQIIARDRRLSPATNRHAIEDTIAEMVRELCDREEAVGERITGVGVAAAGFVSADRSTVLFAPNLAWRKEPLKAEIEARTDLPVVVENDANAAAWGEFQFGAAREVDDMLMVTVGTGIGGGIVLGGRLYRGGTGVAAEIGHIGVVPDGLPCPCGSRGCWEQYASGSAFVRRTREEAAMQPEAAAGLIRRAGTPESITGPLVTMAARAGDDFARRQIDTLALWLGRGIATLTAVLDPAVIIVGGGVAEAGGLLLDPLRQYFDGQLTGRAHRQAPEVRGARLGNAAGLIGVADLARL